ncbi:hypothetical protein GOODEAATRI_019660, partial [Goodea atripinnis]
SQENKTFLAMINNVLTTDGFYFCTEFDLTHTLQRLANTSPDFQEMSLLERADQRFVWNGNLLRELAGQPEVIAVTWNHSSLMFLYINVFSLLLFLCSSTGLHCLLFMDVSFAPNVNYVFIKK